MKNSELNGALVLPGERVIEHNDNSGDGRPANHSTLVHYSINCRHGVRLVSSYHMRGRALNDNKTRFFRFCEAAAGLFDFAAKTKELPEKARRPGIGMPRGTMKQRVQP